MRDEGMNVYKEIDMLVRKLKDGVRESEKVIKGVKE